MARLTAKFIENIQPREARVEVPDNGCRGLYLVVQPSGRKSWALRYRFQRQSRKLTLEVATLAEARVAATAALRELEHGRDPATLKFDTAAKAEAATAERAADTVDRHVAHFRDRHLSKRSDSHQRQAKHVFDNIVLPKWRGRVVHDIKRRDVIDLVESVAADRPIMANRVLGHLSAFFNWMCGRDIIEASPTAGVKPPAAERARERVLTDAEIKALWHGCDAIGGRAGPAIKLMLLTGQRCGEVIGMRRTEIAADLWCLPPERVKNRRRHEVPLSTQALAIIDAIPVIVGDEDFVFTSGDSRRLGNMSHAKIDIDARMRPAAPWVIHDLRRTAASGMARIGVKLPVIEKILNHASGSFRGIVGVYQKYDFAGEKRHALQAWADYVDEIVRGAPRSKVTPIRGRVS